MLSPKNVLFVGAHTDDEVICAGSLKKFKDQGAQIYILTFSNSATKEDRTGGISSRMILEPEYQKSMGLLGANYKLYDYGTDHLHNYKDEIRQIIYDFVNQNRIDCAFVLSPNDDHQCHECVGREAERALKNRVPVILRCQYPWNYKAFSPNFFIELTDKELKTKLDVMRCYQSQLFRYDYVEMFRSYTIADGLSIKRPYAEKFELIRAVL